MNTLQGANLGIMEPTERQIVVCTNLEELTTAVINSSDRTNASFTFGRHLHLVGVVPPELNVLSLKADTSGLPDRMMVNPHFNMSFEPSLGTCWIEIYLASKQISTQDRWLTGANTFFTRNLGSWYSGLRLDTENSPVHDYYATVRHIIFSVYGVSQPGNK